MSYVDAGYAIALATLFVYAVGLLLRRRRWERALRASEQPVAGAGGPSRGERS
jgi:hypothetical protein